MKKHLVKAQQEEFGFDFSKSSKCPDEENKSEQCQKDQDSCKKVMIDTYHGAFQVIVENAEMSSRSSLRIMPEG